MFESITKKKDRSLSYLHIEAGSSSVENAGMAYQSPSLLAAGASARDLALLSTFTNLIFSLLLIKIPGFIKLGESLKRITVILGIVSVVSWFPLILVTILIKSVSPAILITLWIISLIPTLIDGPIRDKWMADLIPGNRLGRYLSLRSAISAGTFLVSFYLLGYILDNYKVGIFSGFPLVYTITLAGCIGSLVMYLLIRAPGTMGEAEEPELGLRAFYREAKQNDIGIFIVYSTLIILTTSISGAFFSVYMLRDLQFTYLTFTMVISIEFLARIVSLSFWGRMVDHAGAINVLRIASVMIPVIPCLWLFSSNIVYLMGVQCISGISWAAYDLCIQSYICGASPKAKRLHYIVYHRSIITMAAALGPLLGSYFLNLMLPVFGNPILGIFLLSGILRLVVVIAILPRLRDTDCNSPDWESSEFAAAYSPQIRDSGWQEPDNYSRIRGRLQGNYYRGDIVRQDELGESDNLDIFSTRKILGTASIGATQNKISEQHTHKKISLSQQPIDYERLFRKPEPVTIWKLDSPEKRASPYRTEEIYGKIDVVPNKMGNIPQDRLLRHPERWSLQDRGRKEAFNSLPVVSSTKVCRLQDNISRDIEYHKRWASKVTCRD